MSLFEGQPALGSWDSRHGRALNFRETCERVGELVLLNASTASNPAWKVVRVTGTSLDPDSHETVIQMTDGKHRQYLRGYAWKTGGARPCPVYALPEKEEAWSDS